MGVLSRSIAAPVPRVVVFASFSPPAALTFEGVFWPPQATSRQMDAAEIEENNLCMSKASVRGTVAARISSGRKHSRNERFAALVPDEVQCLCSAGVSEALSPPFIIGQSDIESAIPFIMPLFMCDIMCSIIFGC